MINHKNIKCSGDFEVMQRLKQFVSSLKQQWHIELKPRFNLQQSSDSDKTKLSKNIKMLSPTIKSIDSFRSFVFREARQFTLNQPQKDQTRSRGTTKFSNPSKTKSKSRVQNFKKIGKTLQLQQVPNPLSQLIL